MERSLECGQVRLKLDASDQGPNLWKQVRSMFKERQAGTFLGKLIGGILDILQPLPQGHVGSFSS